MNLTSPCALVSLLSQTLLMVIFWTLELNVGSSVPSELPVPDVTRLACALITSTTLKAWPRVGTSTKVAPVVITLTTGNSVLVQARAVVQLVTGIVTQDRTPVRVLGA